MTTAFRAIQRGFENVVANWQLLAIRFVESFVIIVIVVVGVIISIVATGVVGSTAGIFDDPERLAEWIVMHPMFLVVACLMFLVVGFVAIVIHSFVFGGVVGCYVDGDRREGGRGVARREYQSFSMQRWLGHAAMTWWPVFIIYNVVWGLWGLVILVPVCLLAVMVFAMGQSEALIAVTCLGIAVVAIIGVLTGIVARIWSELAIVVSVSGNRGIMAPIRDSLSVAADRFVELLVLVVAMFGAGVGVSGFFLLIDSGFNAASASDIIALMTLPGRLASIMVQSLFSVFLSSWTIAGMASIVIDRDRNRARLASRPEGESKP